MTTMVSRIFFNLKHVATSSDWTAATAVFPEGDTRRFTTMIFVGGANHHNAHRGAGDFTVDNDTRADTEDWAVHAGLDYEDGLELKVRYPEEVLTPTTDASDLHDSKDFPLEKGDLEKMA